MILVLQELLFPVCQRDACVEDNSAFANRYNAISCGYSFASHQRFGDANYRDVCEDPIPMCIAFSDKSANLQMQRILMADARANSAVG
jgi:hypothetical protein